MQNFIVLFFSILISSSLFSQNIKGTVSDKNGTPISAVTISWGKNKGCVTNKKGKFNIKIKKGENLIEFQHISFKDKLVHINEVQVQKVNIILEENIHKIRKEITRTKNNEKQDRTIKVTKDKTNLKMKTTPTFLI